MQSSSTLHAFILAMVLHPKIQAKAQAEIDTVIGSGRLPCFDDRSSLPYADAILLELVRWSPVLSLGKFWRVDVFPIAAKPLRLATLNYC